MMSIILKGFIKMIQDNEENKANQAMDSLFCLKLLYKMHLTQNRLLQACLINEDFINVDWNMCDFYRIHSSVMDENFIQSLPANLRIPDTSKDSLSKRGKQSDNDDNLDQPSKKKRQKGTSHKHPRRSREKQPSNQLGAERVTQNEARRGVLFPYHAETTTPARTKMAKLFQNHNMCQLAHYRTMP